MSKIVILAGGTRAESSNNMAASYVEGYLKKLEVPCSIFDQIYLNTPFLLDYEDPQPSSIVDIRDTLIDSDKLIIFSPVFNGGYVSHLKNTLDWLSLGFDNYSYNELFKGKNVAVASSVNGGQLKNYGLKVYEEFYLFTEKDNVDEMIETGKNKEKFQNFIDLFLTI